MSLKSNIFLLADDDPEDMEIFREILLDIAPDMTVICTTDGKEMVEYLLSCADKDLPGIMLIDYNMPKLNGLEVLDKLKDHSRLKNIPKIIWSTSAKPDSNGLFVKHGAKAFFVKPDNFTYIQRVMAGILLFANFE